MESQETSLIPETQPSEEQLDVEISRIREQIKALSQRRSILSSALLSSPSTQFLIAHATPPSDSQKSTRISILQARAKAQVRQNTQNLHRMCAGATMFESKDPDPHAVDDGRIIGVRIEAFSQGSKTFHPPYYLLLNRPNPTSPAVKIHRHTIPPCIPLPALAARYLPSPPATSNTNTNKNATKQPKPQDLSRLVRELRRKIVGYHRRQDAIVGLREELRGGRRNASDGVRDVSAVDAEGQDVKIEWADGMIGRVRMGEDGRVEKVAVIGEDGKRKRGVEKMIQEA